MMRLALDSSIRPSSLAIQKDDAQPIVQTLSNEQASAEQLICSIARLIKEANITLHDIDCLLTAAGPGPFIGLRITLAAAKGMALAADLPIKSAPTLAVLASFVKAKPSTHITARMPARKGWCVFQSFDHQHQQISPMRAASNQDFDHYWQACQTQRRAEYAFMARAPEKPPQPLAAQLLSLPEHCLTDGAEPLYPPPPAHKSELGL